MDGGRIYLREGDGLVPMSEAPYDAEEVLQRLLADFPDLLAGDQMRPSSPRRWLLITQEAAVPDTEGGGGRWSLDHLFVDQDGIPTLVEVKRSSDTRLRREVVGQMLDYAANLAAYWPSGRVRAIFESRCEAAGLDPERQVLDLLDGGDAGPEVDDGVVVDGFWARVSDNLAARRLRLVFVADVIPRELQRIIEFLNEGLVTADVLAVEVKQYVGEGRQTLVPRVIGWTAAAQDVKQASAGPSRQTSIWDDESFRAAALDSGGPDVLALVDTARAWAVEHGYSTSHGKGKTGPMYLDVRLPSGEIVHLTGIDTDGRAIIDFYVLSKHAPFDRVEARLALHERLARIPGVRLDRGPAAKERPSWYYLLPATIVPEAGRAVLFDALDWAARAMTGVPDA